MCEASQKRTLSQRLLPLLLEAFELAGPAWAHVLVPWTAACGVW